MDRPIDVAIAAAAIAVAASASPMAKRGGGEGEAASPPSDGLSTVARNADAPQPPRPMTTPFRHKQGVEKYFAAVLHKPSPNPLPTRPPRREHSL